MFFTKRFWLSYGVVHAATLLCAAAMDWDFYASVRVSTLYEWTRAADSETFADGSRHDVDFNMQLQRNSRIGARVKVDDELSGVAELGISEEDVRLRHLIAHWDFGPGRFSIGQTRTPVGRQDSRRVRDCDPGLTDFGEPFVGRRPLIQLSVHGVTVAAVKPHSARNILDPDNEHSDVDNLMPRLEWSWQHTAGRLSYDLLGGYHTYTIATPETSFDIESYMAGAGLWFRLDDAFMRAIGYHARNARQFGQLLTAQPASFGSAKFDEDGRLVDNDVLAGALFGGYQFNDRIETEIGYGYIQSKDDASGTATDRWHCYYAQLPVELRPGITVTPEVALIRSSGSKERTIYAGAKWQMDF